TTESSGSPDPRPGDLAVGHIHPAFTWNRAGLIAGERSSKAGQLSLRPCEGGMYSHDEQP
ncbi:MAG TPA: hypothetical protein VG145_13970, partial [Xanthobacteraceae bacterium]|nr:hypothetical protein [Xanthobacteraceae bacterium]